MKFVDDDNDDDSRAKQVPQCKDTHFCGCATSPCLPSLPSPLIFPSFPTPHHS